MVKSPENCGRSLALIRRFRVFAPFFVAVALVAIAGCKKKTPPVPPAETAPAATSSAPTAQFNATPDHISAGDQVTLSWRTTDATSVSIEGIGDVPTTGVKTVTPTSTTTYHLVARGAGGTADATTTVSVTAAPAVSVPSTSMSAEEEFKANVQDAFFDYDTYDIRSDAQATLSHDASYLASHSSIRVVIGGYCDERGSDEYNLALGQNRANAAKSALVTAGIAGDRIRVVSYGKEKPFCSESTEECWQQNRRAGFSLDK
jgi:peptidoglycan-associated lipoprotein